MVAVAAGDHGHALAMGSLQLDALAHLAEQCSTLPAKAWQIDNCKNPSA